MKPTMCRKALAFLVSIVMVAGLTPSYAFADLVAAEPETPLTEGSPMVGASTRGTTVEVGSWSEMQSAVQDVSSGQTIKLKNDVVNIGSDKGRIQVKKSVTINLNGYKLDRDLSKRYDNGHVIEVFSGATLTIVDETAEKNGKITGGFSKDGGGIYINDGAIVSLVSGTITGNKATKEGGGVYIHSGGELQMNGGAIDGNTAATCGGGIVAYGKLTTTGGAIRNNTAGDVALNPTSAYSAEGGGVYVCAKGTMSLSNTAITANTAGKNGGGIYIHSDHDGTITGCSITRNSTTIGGGGGIYMDADKTKKLTIENSSIEENESVSGGGIYLYWGTIDMKASDGGTCSLSDNRAANDGGGATVTRNTTFKANGVKIHSNKAETEEGGGIENFGRTELTNCDITNNNAILQGGGIYNDNDGTVDASLSLTNCTVSQNDTSSDGGGIYSDAKIYSDNSTDIALSINGGTIANNFAGTGRGNGLFVDEDSDNPQIQGEVIIEGNVQAVSKQEVYLSKNKLFKLSAALTTNTRIGVTLQESAGVFTENYSTVMAQSSIEPKTVFFSPEGLDVVCDGNNEAKIECYWDDLQRKIDEAQNNGTVIVDRDYTYSVLSANKALKIPEGKHLTIDLQGYTVNRNLSSWDADGNVIVVSNGAELTIQDNGRIGVAAGSGKITGGWGVTGGGVYVEAGATLNFKGGTITGNKATNGGAGIYVDGALIATGGTIENNAAGEGRDDYKVGGIPADYYELFDVGHGGGIYVSPSGTIGLTGVTITNNKTSQNGGGIYTKSEAVSTTITDSSITSNKSSGSGGGIYMDTNDKPLTIAGTSIDGNDSENDGGGIYLLRGTIMMKSSEHEASSMSRNVAKNDSGAIKVEEGATFLATGVSLCYNKALNKEGGAIKNYGTTTLEKCTVDNNYAKKRGGGIYNGFYEGSAEGSLTIEGCAITNNTTEEAGGGIISSRKLTIVGANEDDVSLPATTISGNTATEEGGGIYVGSDAEKTSITGEIIIQGNVAERGNDLYLRSGKKLTVSGKIRDTAIGDIAMEESGTFTEGYGAEYPYNPDDPQENHPSMFFCKADGAIPAAWTENFEEAQLDSAWPDLQQKITDAESGETHIVKLDRDYTANSNDTRLIIHAGETVIINLNGHTINRNLTSVTDNGHVIELLDEANLTITDESPDKTGKIIGGYSKFGGGIYVGYKATLNFNGGTITRNNASQRGGGIFVHSEATLNIGGGTVAGNKSSRSGGGIYVDGTLSTTSGTVDGNTAGETDSFDSGELLGSGGGIYVTAGGAMSLDGLTVTNNSTVYDGGGICLKSKNNTTIKNCTIAYNSATFQGGGIYMDAEDKTLTIEDSHIDGNNANSAGGGFYLRWGTIAMSGTAEGKCTLSDNSAVKEGGGCVVTSDTNCTATNVNVIGNAVAKKDGGGILNAGTSKFTTCYINDNSAPGRGGGVYNTGEGTLTLQSCSVSQNKSESNGGGICSSNKLYLIDGAVLENSASTRGGGIYITEQAGTTGIEGDLIVRDNSAGGYGNDVFLVEGKKLTLTDGLGGDADIGVDLEKGTGTITKDFRAKNPSTDPSTCFIVAEGFDVKVESGEAVITSEWKALKNRIESASDGELIELTRSYAATPDDDRIVISDDKHITIDLKGYTLNRNKGGKTSVLEDFGVLVVDNNGQVFDVSGTLTLKDTSDAKTGTVMGGWAVHGGAIFVHGGATLNLEGGTITGNRASEGGGGIYVNGNGILNMTDGIVEKNASNDDGGSIYVAENGVLSLSGGTITGNTAENRGGGIYVKSGATIEAKGNPIVRKNSAAAAGHDIYLPANTMLRVIGSFAGDARMGIAIEGDYGVFTDGYGNFNPNEKPSQYFVSTQAYAVSKKGNEAMLGPDTFGETEYEKPFVDWNNQIKTDPDVLNGQNWMSGISGERYLNEINIPGSHDSGMYDIQKLTDIALDYTALYSYAAYDKGAFYATTQTKYIYQQLEEGGRSLDLRLNDWYKAKEWYGYDWEDDKENLWICHGTSDFAGTYFAVDENGNLLSFTQVIEWVKDFLKKHPTETVILNMRAETPKSGHSDIIYARARDILRATALQINPSTGEPYLYKESDSNDYFAAYTHMPQLKDCRGKIVLIPQSKGFVEVVGGVQGSGNKFVGTDNEITYTDPTDYTLTAAEQLAAIRKADEELNQDGLKPLPDDASTNFNFLWNWELNCTGESQGYVENYTSDVNPVMHANRVNPGLIGGEGKTFGSDKTGKYIGWVKMDAFSAKYAEPIWRTNIFEGQQYCTITVKSGLEEPYGDQTFQVLKGTTIEIPGNIYKDPNNEYLQNTFFSGWEAIEESSNTKWTCDAGEQFRVDEDTTFTAQWLRGGEIPVRIVWQDGDNADKLRPSSVVLSVPAIDPNASEQTTEITLTSNDGWSAVVSGNAEGIVPVSDESWFKPTNANEHFGQDAAGEYRYTRTLEGGSGLTLTFIHTPQTKVTVAGAITWDDSGNAAGKRPDSVTLHLRAKDSNGDISLEGLTNPITVNADADESWQYGFANAPHELPLYKDGKKIEYVVVQDDVEGYSIVVDGFSITNTYRANAPDTAEVKSIVEWDDAQNVKSSRPESVTVHLMRKSADGTEVDAGSDPLVVTEGEYGLWTSSFGEFPVSDSDGEMIEYSVMADEVPGYYPPNVEPLGPYAFRITNTLKVSDEEKELAEISSEPKSRSLTYNGEPQTLIEAGSSPDGTMKYALGRDGETEPALDDFSTELPVVTNAGTYTVWYYVKGDAFHTDNGPKHMEAKVAKRPVTFSGASDSAIYTGAEIEITGLSVSENGLLDGHTHNVTYSAKSSEVGEHEGTFTALDDVVISSGEDNMTANYDISFASGVLTIEQDPKLEFEATLAGASFAYDGKPHALPTGATDNALSGTTAFEYSKDGKSWTADLPSLTVTDVTDSCTIQVRASNPNYTNAATCEAKLSVEPVKATIKVDNATKVASEADPTFTGKVEGLAADGDLGKVKFVRIGNDEGVGAYKGVLTAEYTPNANYEVTVENGDFTITAKPAVKGTLTFNLGGGTLDGKTGTITIEANVGDTIKLPGAPTKDGYTFKCWRGSEYAAGADYKVEGDHAFTAEWEKSEPAPVVKHMVTFDANGHGKAPAAQEVEDGETIEKPSDPTADDYTFDGWYADKECTKAYVFSTPVTEDITLYAKWTKKSSTNGTSTGSSSSTAKTGDTIGWTAAAFALVGACALCLALLALSRRNRRD